MTVEGRIEDLEWRLEKYHELLTEAITQRDELALGAAWGVHYALHAIVAVIAAYLITDKYIGWDSWIVGFGFALALTPIQIGVHIWSNGHRIKEVDRMAKLPEWELKSGG